MLRTRILLGTALAMVVAAGCTDERPPRSFVQPNVIKKSDLSSGTWHYIQTVADAPPTNGSMFIGQSSSLMNIKFDIQEDYLYARRAYEQIEGSEDEFAKNPDKYVGQPLAAWKIQSHFDIIRDYNSTTGEQTNKIIESTERPWVDREFIRVDWSQNQVTDYVGIGLDIYFSDGEPKVEPVSYWESDPTKPDALHLERAQDDDAAGDGWKKGEAYFLDVTNQMIVTPDNLTATYEENGQIHSFTYPKCFFYYEQDDCASQRIKIRHSFAKIGPNHDYEQRLWDGNQMQLFGVWDVGLRRLAYNRQYGVTNSGAIRRAARFNIWQHSYTGSDQGKTRLAPKDRKLRTIPYYAEGSLPVHYSGDDTFPDGMVDSVYPEDLYPMFAEIVKEWNDAMQVAAFDAMFDGKGGMYDGKQIAKASDLPAIFVPCHNPVRTTDWTGSDGKPHTADPAACAANLAPDMDATGQVVKDKKDKPILHARQGDPRRSTVFWVNQQQNAGPLGYGPPLYDPVTGETISGQAYIYGAALDTYAARSRDLMLLQNGEIDPGDFIDGVNVQDWISQHRFGVASKPQTFTESEVFAMSQAMDFDFAKGMTPEYGYPPIDVSGNKALYNSIQNRQRKIADNYFASRVTDARDQQLARIVGTPLEKAMITPEWMAASGVSPMKKWDDLTEFEKARVSPVRSRVMEQQSMKERMKAEMIGVDFASFDDPGLGQRLARFTTQYGGTLQPHSEEIRQQLRKDIFLAVTLHEVGHNMGLRHNFRASYDAMNYFPDYVDPTNGQKYDGYWRLRTDAMQNPDPGMQQSDGKLHPRYINKAGGAVTRYEAERGIRETQYTSIMDYGAEFNSDLLGLGLYDKAHIKFSYAEYVEVFTDNKTDNATLQTIGSLHTFQNALGFPSPLTATSDLGAIPYHSYPDLFQSGWEGIYKRTDVPYSDISEKPIDQNSTIVSDSEGHPLVPYYFCSDEFAGNLTCQRFDAGADAYEQVTDWISRYKNFYLYNNFKRDRQSFHSSLAYKSRISGRYFDPMREQLTWYVLLRTDFQQFLSTNAQLGFGDPAKVVLNENKFFTDENGWGNFTVAVNLGFETLGQVLTTPTAGWFYQASEADGTKVWKQFRDDTSQLNDPRIRTVPFIDGRYVDTIWDYNGCGYYWAEECQRRIGYMIDKQIALDVLTQSQAYFTGRDTNADVRQYAIGYVIPFKKQLEEKFGAIFANDLNAMAPYFKRVQGDFTPQQPSWSMDDPTIQKGTDIIDPSMGFTVQLYSGVYSLASFPTTFDHDFIDTTKIFVVGNGEASTSDTEIIANGTGDPTKLVSHGGSKEWFVVKDPSGKTFAAHSTAAKTVDVLDVTGTSQNLYNLKTVALRDDQGVRMLEHLGVLATALATAQALPSNDPNKAAAVANAQSEYEKYRENIEVMRSLQMAFGYGQYKTDAPFYY
jgi:Met-zincin